MPKTTKDAGLHDGHRERLKNRFLTSGASSLTDHELLELLLFFSIPRINTNDTAHRLISECGFFQRVLESRFDALCQVDGIGNQSALLIRIVNACLQRYVQASSPMETLTAQDTKKMIDYLRNQFVGLESEVVHLLCLNQDGTVISDTVVGNGSVNAVNFDFHMVYHTVAMKNAACVILAHNHPHASVQPSDDDIKVTANLRRGLFQLGVALIEHYVFSGDGYCPIVECCLSDGYI